MICEHCTVDIPGTTEEAHSAVAVLQKVTSDGYSFYQCENGQEHLGVSYQHFTCKLEHMRGLFSTCVQEHYGEHMLQSILSGGGTSRLHQIILSKKLPCKICSTPLITQGYRFCLTVCTPMNYVPDNSLDYLGEWCCSLDHARQSALAIIQNIGGY